MTDVIDVARIGEDDAYKNELRWRAQTDLFWLAKFVLGYNQITEDHRELADGFVHKDPRKPIEEQDPITKIRLFLMPRRTFKTTFNIADTIQWIIGFPEVAVMIMTASNSPDSPLADAFVAETADHFYVPYGAPEKILTQLFPEHKLLKLPKSGEFNTPARVRYRRDPTVKGVSIEQTAFGLRKVWTNLHVNIKMLADWSYRDHTGTRYGPADIYGRMLEKPSKRMQVLWKPAYIRLPHAMYLDDAELTEEDVILQFPRLLPWDFLRSVKEEDEQSFWTQYMNIAEGSFKPTFPIERLKGAEVGDDSTDHDGIVHVAWRFEYAECKNAAAAVGIERDGRITIVEVIRGQFTPTALARRVVSSAKDWNSHRVEIEDTPGAQSYVQHIRNEALESDWRLEISWSAFLQDDTARSLAIKSAEPHLLAGRLLFAEGISNLQEVFRQLYHFGMVEETEVASVISRVASKLPHSIAAEGFEASDDEAFAAYIEKDAYNRVYGRGQYTQPAPVEELEPEVEDVLSNSMGLSDDFMPGLSG
jgi:hypothetical protein